MKKIIHRIPAGDTSIALPSSTKPNPISIFPTKVSGTILGYWNRVKGTRPSRKRKKVTLANSVETGPPEFTEAHRYGVFQWETLA